MVTIRSHYCCVPSNRLHYCLFPEYISPLSLISYSLSSSIDLIERPSIGETTVKDLINHLGSMLVTLALGMSCDGKGCSPPDASLVLLSEVPDTSGEGFPRPPTLSAQTRCSNLMTFQPINSSLSE